jgi:hypothetical protein
MSIKYRPIRRRTGSAQRPSAAGRRFPGNRGPSPYRKSDLRNTISARSKSTPLELKNLTPNAKYKILAVRDNAGNTNTTDVNRKYIDVTQWFVPSGQSRKYNNRTVAAAKGIAQATARGRKGLGFREVVADPRGKLSGTVLYGPLFDPFRATINRLVNRRFWRNDKYFGKYPNTDITFTVIPADKTIADVEGKPVTTTIRNPPIIIPAPKASAVYTRQKFEVDFVQTFYVDPNRVDKAKSIDLAEITLYIRNRPSRIRNRSKLVNPGINIGIVDMVNGRPLVDTQYKKTMIEKDWQECTPSGDATVGVTFEFPEPVTVETGKYYGIAIDFEDVDYELWMARRGHRVLGTNRSSPGGSRDHRGQLFTRSNASAVLKQGQEDDLFKPRNDIDIKFDISYAEYELDDQGSDIEMNMVNQSYEFLKVNTYTDGFDEDETIYQQGGQITSTTLQIASGSDTLVGTGTNFTADINEGDLVVLKSSNGDVVDELVLVEEVTNTTHIVLHEPVLDDFGLNGDTATMLLTPTAKVDQFEEDIGILILEDSTANTTTDHWFAAGETIVGLESGVTAVIGSVENLDMSVFSTNLDLELPSNFLSDVRVNYTYLDGSTFKTSNANTNPFEQEVDLLEPNYIRENPAVILSKSNEVQNASELYVNAGGTGNITYDEPKSLQLRCFFDYVGPDGLKVYESPVIEASGASMVTSAWLINNDLTNEHTNYGNALTKHVSRELTFKEGHEAEDVRVIYNAFKPPGTDVHAYARIINNDDDESFSEKSWTKLEVTSGASQFSDKDDKSDMVELEFGFPAYPPTLDTLDGVVNLGGESAGVTALPTSGMDLEISGAVIDGDQTTSKLLTLTDVANVAIGAKVLNTGTEADVVNNSIVTAVYSGNNTIELDRAHTGVTDLNTVNIENLYQGEVVKVYNSLFPENYEIVSIQSVAGSTITLADGISNTGVLEDGLKIDKLSTQYTAFNNSDNLNIVRYFDSTGASHDKYGAIAVKTILTSANTQIYPFVDDYRVIGVSA